jgi:hypothetical protein
MRKERAPQSEVECLRELEKFSFLVKNGSAVLSHPRMSNDPVVRFSKSDDKCGVGVNTREHTIEQETALQAIAIGYARYFA